MFPLRSSCFVHAAEAAHQALEQALDVAAAQVTLPLSWTGLSEHWAALEDWRTAGGRITPLLERGGV
jgi:hypothetical protein